VPRVRSPRRRRSRSGAGVPPIVLELRESVRIAYQDDVGDELDKVTGGAWAKLAARYRGIRIRRLFRALSQPALLRLMDRTAIGRRVLKAASLTTFFVIDPPRGANRNAIVAELRTWPVVQLAYIDRKARDATGVTLSTEPFGADQRYLDAAPTGVDAAAAWARPGGDGSGQEFIDVERGWTLDHQDLVAHNAQVLHGVVKDINRKHGTSVLGVVCASQNGIGVVGLAPATSSVSVVAYDQFVSDAADSIAFAAAALGAGGVLLVEAQTADFLPCETDTACLAAIQTASAAGIVVVEAGGNGQVDLDAFVDSGGRHVLDRGKSGEFIDSGAIVVGAAHSIGRAHNPVTTSNLGSRIDCFAWGEKIRTCSSNIAGATTLYRNDFAQTSGASAIIAGVALCVQGIAQAESGSRLVPDSLRKLLTDPMLNTKPPAVWVGKLGVMPDLAGITGSGKLEGSGIRSQGSETGR